MKLRPALALWLVALVAGVLCGRAGGQEMPASGGFTVGASPNGAGESHAWAVMPGDGDGALVFHFPPRGARADGGVPEGTARIAARLAQRPGFAAARAHELYLAFDSQDGRQRTVLAVAAVRSSMGDAWVSDLTAGRLRALPSLPGEGALLGIAGSPRGLLALLESRDEQGQMRRRLLLLSGTAWQEVPLPPEVARPQPNAERAPLLVALPSGAGVFAQREGEWGVWAALLEVDAGSPPLEDVSWEWQALSLELGTGETAPLPRRHLHHVGGRYVYATRARGEEVRVWNPTERGCYLLAEMADVGRQFAVAPLDHRARMVVMWAEAQQDGDAQPARGALRGPTRFAIAEVSVATGRILHEGPVRLAGPISGREFRMLVLALVVLMVVVVVLVMKPEGSPEEISLPRGTALAEPGRRFFAALIDFAPALLIAARATGVPFWEAISIAELLTGSDGWITLLLALSLGFVHCTISEWLFGRSLGKAFVGCEVVAVRAERSAAGEALVPKLYPPKFWQAALRNIIRWALPPVVWAGMAGLSRRHRGDVAAGTVVIIRVVEQELPPERPER